MSLTVLVLAIKADAHGVSQAVHTGDLMKTLLLPPATVSEHPAYASCGYLSHHGCNNYV
jgi:hypothetical protein